jgi:hypothetical protein
MLSGRRAMGALRYVAPMARTELMRRAAQARRQTSRKVSPLFNDKLSLKAVAMGLFGYLLASVIIFYFIFEWWVPPGITDKQQLAHLAETDQTLLILQSWLGFVLGVIAGFAACHFSGARGLKNSLVLGSLFGLYGVLGISLHPLHPTAAQVGKIISPIPITLCGGWLRMLLSRRRREVRSDV